MKKKYDAAKLDAWLSHLDGKDVECDGLTRCASMLLKREGIEHRVFSGSLAVAGFGEIPLHWWIELDDGVICDFRARMWLGDDERIHHGVSVASERHDYRPNSKMEIQTSEIIFHILTGEKMDEYPQIMI